MKNNDGLHEFIEKIEDLATIKTLLVQTVYNIEHGGRPPVIPALNDEAMTDILAKVLERAFRKNPEKPADGYNKDENKSTSSPSYREWPILAKTEK